MLSRAGTLEALLSSRPRTSHHLLGSIVIFVNREGWMMVWGQIQRFIHHLWTPGLSFMLSAVGHKGYKEIMCRFVSYLSSVTVFLPQRWMDLTAEWISWSGVILYNPGGLLFRLWLKLPCRTTTLRIICLFRRWTTAKTTSLNLWRFKLLRNTSEHMTQLSLQR